VRAGGIGVRPAAIHLEIMTRPLQRFSQPVVGDVTICYSGGLDSTTVAFLAAKQNKGRVHLFTLDHGYGYLFNRWSKRTARTLARAVGEDRVIHRIVNTHPLHKRLGIDSALADRRRYGQWFGCCMACTMSMITEAVIYNLERKIPHIMMGSSVGGQYAVMSMPVVIELQKEFCGRYGIIYSTPLLDDVIVKAQERATLEEAGVYGGKRFLDKHSFGNQGYCLLSLQHLPDVLFNVHDAYDSARVREFYLDKLPQCEAYIADYFQRTRQPIQPLIDRLHALWPEEEGAIP